MRSKQLLVIGGCLAGTAVALGAFAAHGLKAALSPSSLAIFSTGVHYQFIHAVAVLICGALLLINLPSKSQKYFFLAANCFIIGVFCFSGSLYALATTEIKWFGPITPIGGFAFMLGWGMFVYASLQIKEVEQ